MLNWFKKNKHSLLRKALLGAFPAFLKEEVETVLDILPFNEVEGFEQTLGLNINFFEHRFSAISLNGESLTIPYRIYFNEPEHEKEEQLNDTQKDILNCIFSRHSNGYIRQKRLENIKGTGYWITPFVFQLLGEYVIEILEVLHDKLDNDALENLKKFALENPEYWIQTESRMTSYWDAYYKYDFPKLKLYTGRLIFDQINLKVIGIRQDEIIEIGIDDAERLFIKPRREKFPLIYTTASEVHWDDMKSFLFSPKPVEWSYYNWYTYIVQVVFDECKCRLIITPQTIWTNIPDYIKKQIITKRT